MIKSAPTYDELDEKPFYYGCGVHAALQGYTRKEVETWVARNKRMTEQERTDYLTGYDMVEQ